MAKLQGNQLWVGLSLSLWLFPFDSIIQGAVTGMDFPALDSTCISLSVGYRDGAVLIDAERAPGIPTICRVN